MNKNQLESFIQEQIPLAKLLGAKILRVDDHAAEILAPLNLNKNHLGTAFGGSLNAFSVLACYTWIFNFLNSKNIAAQILLKSSEIKYHHPVKTDFTAICKAPPTEDLNLFIKALEKKSRARIDLTSAVGSECSFKGEFVAQTAQSFSLT